MRGGHTATSLLEEFFSAQTEGPHSIVNTLSTINKAELLQFLLELDAHDLNGEDHIPPMLPSNLHFTY